MSCAKLSRPARSRPCRRTSPIPPCAASAASSARVGEGSASQPSSSLQPFQPLALAASPTCSARQSGSRLSPCRRGPTPSPSPCPRSSASPSSPSSTTFCPVTMCIRARLPMHSQRQCYLCSDTSCKSTKKSTNKAAAVLFLHFSSLTHIFFLKTLCRLNSFL